jgi:uncharacterized protein
MGGGDPDTINFLTIKPGIMKCPNCEELPVMAERQGIEIDYCPKCRGVWLDKGELDKIIEKSDSGDSRKYSNENKLKSAHVEDNEFVSEYNRSRKKKGGFLSNLFDFD